MTFKAKLRKIGNSLGVITPKEVITDYKEGDVITLTLEKVITSKPGKEIYTPENIQRLGMKAIRRPKFNTNWCSKHSVMKGSCGCK